MAFPLVACVWGTDGAHRIRTPEQSTQRRKRAAATPAHSVAGDTPARPPYLCPRLHREGIRADDGSAVEGGINVERTVGEMRAVIWGARR